MALPLDQAAIEQSLFLFVSMEAILAHDNEARSRLKYLGRVRPTPSRDIQTIIRVTNFKENMGWDTTYDIHFQDPRLIVTGHLVTYTCRRTP